MRASGNKNADSTGETHISGAEGIYSVSEIAKTVAEYTKRALEHPRGKPDRIIITAERLSGKLSKAPLLPVKTLECPSPVAAEEIIRKSLCRLGVSVAALNKAMKLLRSANTMRGASLMLMKTGKRVEPDKKRGIRVSRLGINKASEKRLTASLSRVKINTTTVREALILASKTASSPEVIAEVCISDDPDYTTGYIASRTTGYMRIPNIKKAGEMYGGRVFLLREDADVGRLIYYLESEAVILT